MTLQTKMYMENNDDFECLAITKKCLNISCVFVLVVFFQKYYDRMNK